MEEFVVEKSKFIEEEKYQSIKKETNKVDDWFSMESLEILTNLLKKLT